MRIALVCLLLAGCEKASGVETSSGSGSATTSAMPAPAIATPDASLATTPNDAAKIAIADAAPADAAVARADARRDTTSATISDEDARRIADMLTADSPSGRDMGDMSSRRPGADLGRMIDDVQDSGKRVAIGGGGGRGTRSDGGARVSTGTGPKIDSPTPTDGSGSASPIARVTISSKQAFDESSLTPDIVVAKISSAYMAGIKRCYKTYLNKDATARGKVQLSISVNQSGRSVAPKASGFASEVDSCLTSMMSSWIFPKPVDRDGEPTEASFAIGLTMIPE